MRQESDSWPLLLLLVVVLAPTAYLLWFMNGAMENERVALRQKLIEAYRAPLAAARGKVEDYWKARSADLERIPAEGPASAIFVRELQKGFVDSLLIYDSNGHLLYPNSPVPAASDSVSLPTQWAEASGMERKDPLAAASRFAAIAKESTDTNVAARALQAQVRCLTQAGEKEAALKVITGELGRDCFSRTTDALGRGIVANAELLALELVKDPDSPLFSQLAARLCTRLNDYEHSILPAPQRRFLMKEVQRLSPAATFPALGAEELAARFLESHSKASREDKLQLTGMPGIWQWASHDGLVLALFRHESLVTKLNSALVSSGLPADVECSLLAPTEEANASLLSAAAGPFLPGWHVVLSLKDKQFFERAAEQRVTAHYWTVVLVVGTTFLLALLATRRIRRESALARLKNDLTANVSHELKTPVASIRVLVDTLLNAEDFQERTVREYLQLISRENVRLGRIIENFLTFSRMDRKKHAFNFAPVWPANLVERAVTSFRERYEKPRCSVEICMDKNLPTIIGDADALTTALLNLLDNACKYTEGSGDIVLRAYTEQRDLILAVEDHGIGIPAREQKKIFERFYQSDQRLSRKAGGCGLGLSIVQCVVAAHQGRISVKSEPGQGSTFTLRLPLPEERAGEALRCEAIQG